MTAMSRETSANQGSGQESGTGAKGPFAFLARMHPLGREIAVLLTLKLAALIAIANLFFSPDDRPVMTDRTMDRHILATTATGAAAPHQENGPGK